MKIPAAPEERDVTASLYWGISNGGGGVKVGMRVCVGWTMNAAANVGSMVAETSGVGVGGGSAI